jgi:hypothetical protein
MPRYAHHDTRKKPVRDTRETPAPIPDGDRTKRTTRQETGTSDQKPRWEGPPENRPPGYLPAKDDPDRDRDAAGENLRDPEKSDLGDAFKTKKD